MSIENKIHFFEEFFWFKDVCWEIRFRSIRVFISGIIAVLLIGIPLTADGMSGRPPVNPERLENEDYFQKSDIDSRKILIKDKDDNVKGLVEAINYLFAMNLIIKVRKRIKNIGGCKWIIKNLKKY